MPPDAPDPGVRPTSTILSFRRRRTQDSVRGAAQPQREVRSQSFRIQAEREREAARPKRYQQSYSVYNGLTWPALWTFLHKKWPNEEFVEVRKGDNWVFETPEQLTESDSRAIAKLRDNTSAQQKPQRDSVSPEP